MAEESAEAARLQRVAKLEEDGGEAEPEPEPPQIVRCSLLSADLFLSPSLYAPFPLSHRCRRIVSHAAIFSPFPHGRLPSQLQ